MKFPLSDARATFIGLVVLSLATIGTAVVSSSIVERQLQKQCMNRDWPEDQDRQHFDLCVARGHVVGPKAKDIDTDVSPNVSFSEVDAFTSYDAEKAIRSDQELY